MAGCYFMGIDTGTFASKGVIIDADANVIAESSAEHGMENPKPGYYEHDAEAVWWHDFCQISNDLIAKSGIDPKDIKGVAASALGADCLSVDEECRPLRKAILYGIDARALDQCHELTEMYGESQIKEWFGRPLGSSDVMPKILWIKENEPEVYAKTHKFLTGSSYITAKLTGSITSTSSSASQASTPFTGRTVLPIRTSASRSAVPTSLQTLGRRQISPATSPHRRRRRPGLPLARQ